MSQLSSIATPVPRPFRPLIPDRPPKWPVSSRN